jgi:heterodisulfide reductase subunit D
MGAVSEKFPFAKYFGEINVLAALQFTPGERPFFGRPPAAPEPKDLLLYLGCNVLRTAHLAKTIIEVLRAMGFDFNAVGGPENCCGIIHHLNGEPRSSSAYSAHTLSNFARYGAQRVIMWCPSCNEHFDGVVTREHEVPFPYEHVTAFVAAHLDRIRFVGRVERRVALHYHTGHRQQDSDWASTRAILRAIPGLDYVEIDNPPALGRHCSPKYVNQLGRSAWQAHLTEICRRATEAGADVLANIYHSCHREICHEQGRWPLEIVNWVSLLGQAMGIVHPDLFKRYRLLGDPEVAFQELREAAAAHGLDPGRVREVLAKSFAPACETTRLPNPS